MVKEHSSTPTDRCSSLWLGRLRRRHRAERDRRPLSRHPARHHPEHLVPGSADDAGRHRLPVARLVLRRVGRCPGLRPRRRRHRVERLQDMRPWDSMFANRITAPCSCGPAIIPPAGWSPANPYGTHLQLRRAYREPARGRSCHWLPDRPLDIVGVQYGLARSTRALSRRPQFAALKRGHRRLNFAGPVAQRTEASLRRCARSTPTTSSTAGPSAWARRRSSTSASTWISPASGTTSTPPIGPSWSARGCSPPTALTPTRLSSRTCRQRRRSTLRLLRAGRDGPLADEY